MDDVDNEELMHIANGISAKLKGCRGIHTLSDFDNRIPGSTKDSLIKGMRWLLLEEIMMIHGLPAKTIDNLMKVAVNGMKPKPAFSLVKIEWPTKFGPIYLITKQ